MEKTSKHRDDPKRGKPKRIGQKRETEAHGPPNQPPVSGERVSLGLRVTAQVKRLLDNAAARSGRSQSQEAEWRLENSLNSDKHLMLVQGHRATPVVFREGQMLIPDGYGSVALPISLADATRILDYFREQYPPFGPEFLDEEVEAAGDNWMQLQRDIEKGK